MPAEALTKKEAGNNFFKDGKFEEALQCYTEALNINDQANHDAAVFHKNRAACYLKMEKYNKAATECTKALDITPNDPKALFRRCQALQALEKYEDAYKDASILLKVDPKNKAVQPILMQLMPLVQERMKRLESTESKVSQMFKLVFGQEESDMEKRRTAANNLIVLAKEDHGADKIIASGGIKNLLKLIDTEKDPMLRLTAIRVVACLARDGRDRARSVYDEVTLKKICYLISEKDDSVSAAAANILQNIILSLTDLDNIKREKEAYEKKRVVEGNKMRPFPLICEKIPAEGKTICDQVFPALIQMLPNKKVSKYARDNVMELIIKFVGRKEGCGWPVLFVEAGGIRNLLDVAGVIPEHKILSITHNSRMHASLALQKVFDELLSDKERDKYKDQVNEYFSEMFADAEMETKLEAIMALSALLQGPYEVGNMVLGREGVLEMMLAMADSGNAIHTKYAVEALVHSASKKDRCSGVIKQATPILKTLYQSQNDTIKVRALVGLCKLGSFGGADASAQTFADGSNLILAKACRKYLCNASKDVDLRKWAAEGLAYLTLSADVKEELVEDENALQSLMELAKVPDKGILYPIAQIFVNTTNSYDKKEVEPEMVELAKFAKQHVPEEHPKDKDEFIQERVNKLVKAGIIGALVALSNTESENSKEHLARVYFAVCKDQAHRGLVVQLGGAKALIPLALKGTEKGKAKASQALAKIAITTNPEIAFPGQRVCEVVRPLLSLLDIQKDALVNFEGLMALTNLASMNDTIRERIIKEKGYQNIEYYMYEEHESLRRAATECCCNMVQNEKVVEMFKGKNDRIKLLVLFCAEDEDMALVRAASGALAILSSEKEICHKIITSTDQWFEILQGLAASPMPDIQHRIVFTLRNMVDTDKEIAQKFAESTMLEVLMAISKLEEPERQQAKQCAEDALSKLVEYELIKANK